MEELNQSSSQRIIKTFAAASFLNDMGSDIIYPIWPLFVTSVLKANMAALGFLDGLGDALVSLSQAGSGFLSDKLRKRKLFIWIGYLFGALSRIGYALSSLWTHLIPFRALDRTGKIRSAPRDALVADVSTISNRGKNFGLLRTMDHLGAVAGIVICIIFFRILGYRLLFALAAIPSLASALLVLFLIKEKKRGKLKIYKGITLKELSSNFKLFLILSSTYSLGAFSYSFLLVYARNFGFKTTFVPVLYLIFTASASFLSYPFGKLSDKAGRKRVIFIAFFLWATVCLSFIFARSFLLIIIAFFLYGAHKGALEPVQKTFVCELSPQKYRASGLGGFQMVTGLCALPASFLAGLLWETFGPLAPFYFSLSLTFVSGLMLFSVKEKQSKI
ncbi:MAG: MFS transporter [Candidatus Aminicenantales bacterium]